MKYTLEILHTDNLVNDWCDIKAQFDVTREVLL